MVSVGVTISDEVNIDIIWPQTEQRELNRVHRESIHSLDKEVNR